MHPEPNSYVKEQCFFTETQLTMILQNSKEL